MNSKMLIIIAVVVVIFGGIVYVLETPQKDSPEGSSVREAQEKTETQHEQKATTDGKSVTGYMGKVLAGTKSPLVIFNLPDYEKARKENKIIVLDFFANWCPECREEAPKLQAGFDSLQTDKVVGFRVNYNDTDTDQSEKDLAGKYAITFQHTKVILKDGKEFSKSVDLWDKDTFLAEVNKAL